MTTATETPDTLADVVAALGDIPIHRILYSHLGSATEDDGWTFWNHKIRAELVDGVFVVKAIDRDTLRQLLDQFVPGTDTLADVVDRLGDVPLGRILWTPRPGTATEDDVVRLVDGEPKRLVELVDGILVEKPRGHREGLLAAVLGSILLAFVRSRNLGLVGGPDVTMRLTAGRVRLPDISFTAWESLPTDDAHLQRVANYAPDLAVEILSPNNTRKEIERKRREYFAAGTKLVWIVDPDARTVAVFTGPDTHTLLTAADTLDGGTVLPGFTLPLADLFNDPQLNPRPSPA
jgi:Uma2 family endonuclease